MRSFHLISAAAIIAASVATTASAGGFAATVVEPPVVVVEPEVTRSSWGIILPLLGVAVLIALAGSSGESPGD
jgi:hypothetical protein